MNKGFKLSQIGRTMLETLLVIFLLGLLGIMGLYGYQVGVAKSEAHSINSLVATLVQERRQLLQGENARGTRMPQKVPGPYGVDITVENGVSGDQSKYFSVSMTIQKKGLCKELLKSQYGNLLPTQITINGEINGECQDDARVAFWYEKDSGVGGELNTYTEDGKTYACPLNATCTEGNFRCNHGYYRSGSSCLECPATAATCTHEGFTCPSGQVQTATNCISCDEHAVECDEAGVPRSCIDGYYLKDNECKPCLDANAVTCGPDGKATSCDTGYCLHNGQCDELPDNAECTSTGFKCKSRYYRSGNSCLLCPTNAQTCTSDGFTCKAGYYKDASECTQCGERQISSAGGSCTTCTTPGKTNNADHTACTENCSKGDQNCGCTDSTPYADGNGGCEVGGCPAGKKYNSNNECVSCLIGENCGCPENTPYANGNGGCFANFSCPENSSLNVVEGNQILNSICYCEEGYVAGSISVFRGQIEEYGKAPYMRVCAKKCSSNSDCVALNKVDCTGEAYCGNYYCGHTSWGYSGHPNSPEYTVCLPVNIRVWTDNSITGKELKSADYQMDYWSAQNWCAAQTINGKSGQLLDMSSNPFECYKNDSLTTPWSWPDIGSEGVCCAYGKACFKEKVYVSPFGWRYNVVEPDNYSEKFKSFVSSIPTQHGTCIFEGFWLKNESYYIEPRTYDGDGGTKHCDGLRFHVTTTIRESLKNPLCE